MLPLDPDLSFEDAVAAISATHEPGSYFHGIARNVLVEAWGQLVGRTRALAEFDHFVATCGSWRRTSIALRATKRTLQRWRAAFESLPLDRKQGRLQGTVVGGWFLKRRLGAGGNSEVWLGRKGDKDAAVKVLRRARGQSLARFQDEARAQKALADIPGVLPILEASGPEDVTHRPWIALPVATPLSTIGLSGVGEVLSCVSSIARTLSAVHARGYSHRDLKPQNLFKRSSRWEVGDFGLVDFPSKQALTQSGRKLGSLYYAAPEMLNGATQADGAAADVYALAKCVWVLASGQNYPVPGQLDRRHELLRLQTYCTHPAIDEIETLLDAATVPDPHARPSMREFSERLLTCSARTAAASEVSVEFLES